MVNGTISYVKLDDIKYDVVVGNVVSFTKPGEVTLCDTITKNKFGCVATRMFH